MRRAATLANGWLPACLTPGEYAAGLHRIRELRVEAGATREAPFDAAMQMVVAIGGSHEAAGNGGTYPHNGSVRVRCTAACAEAVADDWTDIVTE